MTDTPDFRALCAALADELELNRRLLLDDITATHPLAERARAALAADPQEPTFTPEEVELIQAPWSYLAPTAAQPQGPSDRELSDAYWAGVHANRESENRVPDHHAGLRAVLARWGNTRQRTLP